MAVLVTAEVPGQTPEGYDGMLKGLEPLLVSAPGFICHAAYSDNGTWRVLEIWDSAKAATEFFFRVRASKPSSGYQAETRPARFA